MRSSVLSPILQTLYKFAAKEGKQADQLGRGGVLGLLQHLGVHVDGPDDAPDGAQHAHFIAGRGGRGGAGMAVHRVWQ